MKHSLDLFTSQTAYTESKIPPQHIVDESDDTPHENPSITVIGHFIEESLEVIDDAITLSNSIIPQTSIPRKLGWIKRKLMWIKRKYKQYKVWAHKLGKFELEPNIRANQRDLNILKVKVKRLQDQIDQLNG